MLKNKKGAALLQVLLVTVVLAGMATMLLRASLSRTTTARQTRRTVSGQLLVNACMAEINALWSAKTPEAFSQDLNNCIISCDGGRNADGTCKNKSKNEYTCREQTIGGITYTVKATMGNSKNSDAQCPLTYEISAKNAGGTEIDVEF